MKKEKSPLYMLAQIFTGVDTKMVADGWQDYTDKCDSEWAEKFHCFDCEAPLEYVRYGKNSNNGNSNQIHEQTQIVYCPDCSACYGIVGHSDMPTKTFGEWKAFKSGVEYDGNYFLEYYRFSEDDWVNHLRKKKWFNKNCEHDFVQAVEYCKQFNNTPSVRRLKRGDYKF